MVSYGYLLAFLFEQQYIDILILFILITYSIFIFLLHYITYKSIIFLFYIYKHKPTCYKSVYDFLNIHNIILIDNNIVIY